MFSCHKLLDIRTVEYDHIKPWADKGRTINENGVALCRNCHGLKTHNERSKKINNRRRPKSKKSSGMNYPEVKIPKFKIPKSVF